MSEANNGGPAFPKAGLDPWGQAKQVQTGMDLRDYFAAKAMQSMVANEYRGPSSEPLIAKQAYGMADAMLRARSAAGQGGEA